MSLSRSLRIIGAALWQIWRLNRDGIVVGAGSFAAFALLIRLFGSGGAPPLFVATITFLVVLPLLGFLISVFSLGEHPSNQAGPVEGFPRWMLKLPVRTSVLVAVPMLAAAVGTFVLWASLVYFLYRPLGANLHIGLIGGALSASVVVFQAMAWTTFANRSLRIGVAAMVAPVPLLLAMLQQFAAQRGQLRLGSTLIPLDERLWALIALYLLLAFVIAVAGVERLRRGGAGRRRGSSKNAWRFPRPRSRRNRGAFRSSRRAQIWMDWQSRGFALPLFVAIGLGALFGLLTLAPPTAATARLTMGLTLILPIVIADLLGYGFARSYVSSGRGLSPFTAMRPIATRDLFLAFLAVGATSTALAWVMTLTGLSVWLSLSGHWELGRRLVAQLTSESGLVALPALIVTLYFVSVARLITGFAAGIGRSPDAILTRIALLFAVRISATLVIVWATLDADVGDVAWWATGWLASGIVVVRTAALMGVAIRHGRLAHDSRRPPPWWLLGVWFSGAAVSTLALGGLLPAGIPGGATLAAVGIVLLIAPPSPWLAGMDGLERARCGGDGPTPILRRFSKRDERPSTSESPPVGR